MQRNNKFRALFGDILGLLVLALVAWGLNWLTVDDYWVYTLSYILFVAVGNFALALPARFSMTGTAGSPLGARMAAAAALVVLSLAVLCVDYLFIMGMLEDIDLYIASALATFFTALIWIAAYVIAWRPFLARRENQLVSAGVTLVLACLSMALFFVSLFADAVFDASSWQVSFVRFAFSCVSFASAISAFLNQWESRQERLRRIRRKKTRGLDIEVREFAPEEDLAEAECFAFEGMHLDRYVKNEFESWVFSHDAMCEAVSRSTCLYGAYEDDRLVGFLFAAERGVRKPYERSRYARFHRFAIRLIGIADSNDANDAYEAANARMLAGLDAAPDVEIVFFACDPELKGKGIGSALLGAFEADFAGKLAFLYTDDACDYQFYEHRGFTRAASERIEEEAPGGSVSLDCMLYTKQL